MRQVRQRISLHYQTTGLSQEETRAYLPGACRLLAVPDAKCSRPRRSIPFISILAAFLILNVYCEHAMIQSFTRQRATHSRIDGGRAAKELQFDDVRPIVEPRSESNFFPQHFAPEPVLSESLLEPPPVITETPLAPLSIPAIAVVAPAPVVSEPVMPESAVSRVEAPVAESSPEMDLV